MADRLRITIPLPPKALSPNFHGSHWFVKDATKAYRKAAGWAAKAAMSDRSPFFVAFDRATVTATFYCGPTMMTKAGVPDGLYRPLDSTNANDSLKAAIDGLKDAGVFPEDDHTRVRMMPPTLLRRKKEHQGRAEVLLEIEEWVAE